jgi:D-methionine transport system permease protein
MIEALDNILGTGMTVMYLNSIATTVKITLTSTFLAYLIGFPLGIILYGTASESIFPNKYVNAATGFIVNILRSIPFVILLVMTQPLASVIIGTRLGDNAFIFHLVIAAAPFVARMIESSLKEVDAGVIEAAQSMGSNNFQIITKVVIPEAKPSLIIGSAIAITTILGYTPMTYLIAGGGLGEMAVRYGLYKFDEKTMYISSILLIILVQILQETLNHIAKSSDKRIRNK